MDQMCLFNEKEIIDKKENEISAEFTHNGVTYDFGDMVEYYSYDRKQHVKGRICELGYTSGFNSPVKFLKLIPVEGGYRKLVDISKGTLRKLF
ncbi:MAG: hypothetical protein ACOCQR_02140 [bacterium]